MADTKVLGAFAPACRFKSCCPHQMIPHRTSCSGGGTFLTVIYLKTHQHYGIIASVLSKQKTLGYLSLPDR